MRLDDDHGDRRVKLLRALSSSDDVRTLRVLRDLHFVMEWAEQWGCKPLPGLTAREHVYTYYGGNFFFPEELRFLSVEAYELPYEQALVVAKELVERQEKHLNATFTEELVTMLATAVVSRDDPTKVAYLPNKEADKYRRTSWTKFLRALRAAGLQLSDSEIEVAQAYLSTAFDMSSYSHKILTGEDLYDVYDNGEFGRSCMTGGHDGPRLYAENPDKVAVVAVYRNGYPHGRALLWTTDDGEKFLDRIYPTDGNAHEKYLEDLAEKEGWATRDGPKGIGGEAPSDMRVTLRDVGYYPYMDTFAWVVKTPYDTGDGTFVVAGYEGVRWRVQMTGTEGHCPWEDDSEVQLLDGTYMTETHCNHLYEIGDVLFDSDAGQYDYADNFVEVLNHGDFFSINNTRVVEVEVHETGDSNYLLLNNYRWFNSRTTLIEQALEGTDYRLVPAMKYDVVTDQWLETGDGDAVFTCTCEECEQRNLEAANVLGVDLYASIEEGEVVYHDEVGGKQSFLFVPALQRDEGDQPVASADPHSVASTIDEFNREHIPTVYLTAELLAEYLERLEDNQP